LLQQRWIGKSAPPEGIVMDEPVLALTSLSPNTRKISRQRSCIASWLKAGLKVISFNHLSELEHLAAVYPIEFVPVEKTTANIFGGHFIPVYTMLDWAARQRLPILLINSDIELQLAPSDFRRIRRLSEGGLCYFVRHNHDLRSGRVWREPFGIDAFLLNGRDAELFAPSFLSVGQPFWDYWIPHIFAAAGRPIFSVEFPAVFHQCHAQQWSWQNWHRCALEFNRMTGVLESDESFGACKTMSWQVREHFDRGKRCIASRPFEIRAWVERAFCHPGKKTFLELGAHDGEDTEWMAALPDTIIHAFEPDPRNCPLPRSNVFIHRLAVGDRDGRCPFVLSTSGWGREWTHSSSIKAPKNHLSRYPVTFGETIEVAATTLDSFSRMQNLGQIDFIWADIQGAEGEMIRGGRETLARTRFLFTEYSDDELYEGQITLSGILELLCDFRVVELWPDDVLLENTRFTCTSMP
jgi:FkbM family methyltransferase